jgi:hypothetical protein
MAVYHAGSGEPHDLFGFFFVLGAETVDLAFSARRFMFDMGTIPDPRFRVFEQPSALAAYARIGIMVGLAVDFYHMSDRLDLAQHDFFGLVFLRHCVLFSSPL